MGDAVGEIGRGWITPHPGDHTEEFGFSPRHSRKPLEDF